MTQKNANVVEFPSQAKSAETSNAVAGSETENKLNLAATGQPQTGIALALGGGAARGWSHIGVLRAIDEAKIPVSMIAGTSIGALVGGCYLAGKLDALEEFARSITRRNILRYMDFAFRASGLISGMRLAERMEDEIGHLNIEDLDRRFIAIATDINSGNEIWLENGSLVSAIRASYALPGVFEPVSHLGRMMVDGALVNPVPVSACRAFEQKLVLAVNLSSEVFGRSAIVRSSSISCENRSHAPTLEDNAGLASWFTFTKNQNTISSQNRSRLGVTGVMIEAFNIIQDKIVRSRLACDLVALLNCFTCLVEIRKADVFQLRPDRKVRGVAREA
ncbi:MAG: patatin-like phospholipase family protein [Rhizobiaceae bacterium]|nr:patatin-like phospholipase family protein [Rhizobiaceae bacterium]